MGAGNESGTVASVFASNGWQTALFYVAGDSLFKSIFRSAGGRKIGFCDSGIRNNDRGRIFVLFAV